MITLGLMRSRVEAVLPRRRRARSTPGAIAGAGGPRRRGRLLWAALAAAVTALAAWAAPGVAAQLVAGVRAELALHRTVAGHELRIATLEAARAAELEAHRKEAERMDRLIELLEREQRAREKQRR